MILLKSLIAFCAVSTAYSLHVDPDWLEKLMVQTDEQQKISKVLNFKTSPAASIGTDYGSENTRITMDVLLKSGENVNASVVVVALPSTPIRQRNINESGLFKTDILVHRLVLPKMEEVMKEVGDESEPVWINALDLQDYEQLILEDVEADGYKRRDKIQGLDLNDCEMAMVSIAKFHALSAVLNERHQLPVDNFIPLLIRNKEKIGKFYEAGYEDFAKSIKSAWGSEWSDAERIIRKKSKTIDDDMRALLQKNDDSFGVLNHGGFFITKLLFINGISDVYTSKAPIAMKIYNYQVAHFNSPAFDLQFFLNTSPQISLMTEKKDHLINTYFEALIKYLKQFHYKGALPTAARLANEMKRTELYGLTEAINHLTLLYLKPEDIPDFEKVAQGGTDGETATQTVRSPGRLNPRYIRALKLLLRRAIDNKVFQ